MNRYKVTTNLTYYTEAKDKKMAQYNFIMKILNHINLISEKGTYVDLNSDIKVEKMRF